MWRTYLAAVLALALGAAGAVCVASRGSGFAPRLEETDEAGWQRLPNGLRVAIRPIEGATQVAVLTMFDLGDDHDPAGRSGLAHLTEHLYVTSAAGATPARTAEEWETKYGNANCTAETTQSCTVYLVKVPPSALEDEIADAAARMSDLRIEASDLDRERPRVLEQIAEHEAAAPGRKPVAAGWVAAVHRIRPLCGGGAPDDVRAMSLAELRERAHRFYGPADARLVVTGAVDAAVAKRLVAKYFARVPGGERAPPARDRGATTPGGRIDVECGKIAPGAAVERSVWIAWPGPLRDDPDSAAMQLLDKRARRPSPEPRLFQSMSFLAEGVVLLRWTGDDVPVEDVIKASDELVARFVAEPPTADEIDSIAPRRTSEPYSLEIMAVAAYPEMLAMITAESSRQADPGRLRESLESLTKDDLARIAAKWLDPRKRVVSVARGPVSPPADEVKLPPYWQEVFKNAGVPGGTFDKDAPSVLSKK